ncbi:MAG TPA: slipin family protein [Chitinophagaceae bacterium]|nr:slipin family protein [Chitinophagaceae bacterium]HRG92523.1 slipin family protein [Chitinophagaceae bacterium]
MKKVKVNEWQVALVFKNGAYKKMLLAGNYWFWKNEDVFVYDITKQFVAPVELNILLQDQSLAEILQVIEVKENEIVLQYENGLLKQVLSAGRYAFWKSVVKNEFIRADISQVEIDLSIDRTTLSKAPLNNWVRSTEVQSNEKGVLFMDAKMVGLLEPGIYYWWKNQVSIQVAKTDMRKLQLEVNGQEILTRDKAALRLNAWLQYQVTDIVKALVENKEYDKQLYVAVQLALREYIAVYSFDELLEKKESLAPFVLQQIREKAESLGVTLNGFGIRDIILPGDIKEIMNQVLVAEKKAQANSIMRREETASTRSLLNTAKLMEENAMLWKLKEMEYVEKIAEKISNISVNGSGDLLSQLKQIFVTPK